MSIRGLILDYGEVLSLPQPADALPGMAAAAQAAALPFADAYWRYRGDYDRGMPATEYWQSVLADAHAACRQADDIQRLVALDVRLNLGEGIALLASLEGDVLDRLVDLG